MGMTITRFEKTIIPQTLEGQKFANEYEKNTDYLHRIAPCLFYRVGSKLV